MNFLKFTRHAEWYEPKLIPLLGIGYLVIYLNRFSLDISALRLLFLMASITVGAIYVSVINDICDIREDVAAGKPNRMQGLSSGQKALLLSTLIATGICCGYFIYPDGLSICLYAGSWIVFSLYSIYPFRFKERGILGVLCDASGAHLFPTLLIICNLTYTAGLHINLEWTVFAGIWAFFYGLRGILWHQFYDRDNDLVAGTKTFASGIEPRNFKWAERVIFAVELIGWATITYLAWNVWLFILFILYVVLMVVRVKKASIYPVIILTPANRRFNIVLHDFYLVFFPLAILWDIALTAPYGWLLLGMHVLIFPRPVYRIARDFFRLVTFKPL